MAVKEGQPINFYSWSRIDSYCLKKISGVVVEDSIQGIIATLRSICADEAAEENVRSAAAKTLGLCVYLCSEQTATKLEALQTLKTLWSSMRPSSASATLFTSALLSWALLLERVRFFGLLICCVKWEFQYHTFFILTFISRNNYYKKDEKNWSF